MTENVITDVSNFIGLPFLRVSDVKQGDKLVITSSLKEVESFGKRKFNCNVLHNGITKQLSLSSPHLQQLADLYGVNSMGWIGKTIRAGKKEVKLKDGRKVETLDFVTLEKVI